VTAAVAVAVAVAVLENTESVAVQLQTGEHWLGVALPVEAGVSRDAVPKQFLLES
jgi:hypothetical protein